MHKAVVHYKIVKCYLGSNQIFWKITFCKKVPKPNKMSPSENNIRSPQSVLQKCVITKSVSIHKTSQQRSQISPNLDKRRNKMWICENVQNLFLKNFPPHYISRPKVDCVACTPNHHELSFMKYT